MSAGSVPRGCYFIASRVHKDDVHGMCTHTRDTIISGSKDTTVRVFSASKGPIATVSQPPQASYTQWVTGLDCFEDGSWVAGRRNGFLECKSLIGDRTFFAKKMHPPVQSVKADCYKPRNESRITGVHCLSQVGDRGYNSIVGFPECFLEINFTTRQVVRSFFLDEPEWVYGFAEIEESIIAAIHGASLSLFEECGETWTKLDTIVTERPPVEQPGGRQQRQFISHISPMQKGNVTSLAIAYFGGATEIVDVKTQEVLFRGSEHARRVWQAVSFKPNQYASCADDGLVKIWDQRQEKSAHTLAGHPGRVSALAFLDENRFVAGTCPDNPHESDKKAQFYFYDTRKI